MTFTAHVRVNWPVPAVQLLDAATHAAGGDPATVERHEEHPSPIWNTSWVTNKPHQGLLAYLHVRWGEQPDHGDAGHPEPPALVILTIDTPETAKAAIADAILPAVRDWLDDQGVPRTTWWWDDEKAGTRHPGATDVAAIADPTLHRDTWNPQPSRPGPCNSGDWGP